MNRSSTLALSLVISAFLFLLMNTYYLDQGFSTDLGKAALELPMSMGIELSSDSAESNITNFAAGMIIEYSIVLAAVYLMFRGMVKTFGRSQ